MSSGFQGKCRKLYIGGLVENVLKDDLARELSKCGEVVDVWVARNPPGFAFAEYVKSSDAEKAVRSLNGINVCGSRIRVEFAHGGRTKSAIGSAFHGGRSSGRGSFRRRSSRHSNRDSSYNGHRHADYDQFSSFHSSEIASAATASGYPYGVSGYQSVLPFLPSTEFIRSLQSQSRRRSSPGRIQFPVNQRGHSPISRRRSRSPLGVPVGRPRGRSPLEYNGRSMSRHLDMRGRGGYSDFPRSRIPRGPRTTYSPPFVREINGRHDESRGRRGRDDRRRR